MTRRKCLLMCLVRGKHLKIAEGLYCPHQEGVLEASSGGESSQAGPEIS